MSAIVERFLHWARDAPAARRSEAAGALARAYLVSPLSPQERDDVEAAMTALLDDSSTDVRLALAEALAASDLSPHHIVLGLACDCPAVAAIVAERSPLILDTELVDMIGSGDEALQLAIARRPFLSRALSAAMAEVGTSAACLTMIANPGARVPRFSLERVVERHGDCPELRHALLQRDDLPPDIRQVLVGRLTRSLCALVVDNAWLPAERAAQVTDEARERATIAAAFEADAGDMPVLVRQLAASGELTPAFLIRAAAAGQSLLFETALALLAGIPRNRVGALVGSGRGGNLKAVLQRAGLPPRTFPAFAAAVAVIRVDDGAADALGDYRRATHLIDAIIAQYGRKPDRELDDILALLRRFATEAKRSAARGFVEQVLEAA